MSHVTDVFLLPKERGADVFPHAISFLHNSINKVQLFYGTPMWLFFDEVNTWKYLSKWTLCIILEFQATDQWECFRVPTIRFNCKLIFWGHKEREGGNKTCWVKRLHTQVRNKYNYVISTNGQSIKLSVEDQVQQLFKKDSSVRRHVYKGCGALSEKLMDK